MLLLSSWWFSLSSRYAWLSLAPWTLDPFLATLANYRMLNRMFYSMGWYVD